MGQGLAGPIQGVDATDVGHVEHKVVEGGISGKSAPEICDR